MLHFRRRDPRARTDRVDAAMNGVEIFCVVTIVGMLGFIAWFATVVSGEDDPDRWIWEHPTWDPDAVMRDDNDVA